MPVLTDPQRLEILKLLQAKPQMSQRDLAEALGVSLGKANYCLKALMDKGLVKLENFRRNPDKREYAYGIGKVFWEASRKPQKGAPRVMIHPQGINLAWELN